MSLLRGLEHLSVALEVRGLGKKLASSDFGWLLIGVGILASKPRCTPEVMALRVHGCRVLHTEWKGFNYRLLLSTLTLF